MRLSATTAIAGELPPQCKKLVLSLWSYRPLSPCQALGFASLSGWRQPQNLVYIRINQASTIYERSKAQIRNNSHMQATCSLQTCRRPPKLNTAFPPELRGIAGVPRTSMACVYTTFNAISSPSPYTLSSFEVKTEITCGTNTTVFVSFYAALIFQSSRDARTRGIIYHCGLRYKDRLELNSVLKRSFFFHIFVHFGMFVFSTLDVLV